MAEKNLKYIDLVYPSSLADENVTGRAYVKFQPKIVKMITKLQKSNLVDKEKRIEEQRKVALAKGLIDGDKIVNSIILPISKASDNLKSNYKLMEGLDLLASGDYLQWFGANSAKTAQFIGQIATKIPGAGMIGDKLQSLSNVMTSLPEEWKALARSVIGGGFMENPHDMLIYNGTDRRNFVITYNLLKPQNKDDEETLRKIRKIFRASQIGDYRGIFSTISPFSWFVGFYSYGVDLQTSIEPFLQYNNCGLVNAVTNFGGNNDIFTRTPSGDPITDMTLSFAELERMGTNSWDRTISLLDEGGK